MELTFENGRVVSILDANELAFELKSLGIKNNTYAILAAKKGFAQVSGSLDDGFVIEYQLPEGEHYNSVRNNYSLSEITEFLMQYFNGEDKFIKAQQFELFDVFTPDEVIGKKRSLNIKFMIFIGIALVLFLLSKIVTSK